MTAVISETSNFEYVLNNLKSNLLVNLRSQNGILYSYLVVLDDFLMFENESKFCQN